MGNGQEQVDVLLREWSEQLEEVVVKRSAAEATVAELSHRETTLRAAIEAVIAVSGAQPGESEVTAPSSAHAMSPSIPTYPDLDDTVLPQPQRVTRRQRSIKPESAAYRVGVLVLEAHRELDRDEIVQAFEDRNWADPSWKAVRPAVLSAIDRARNYGWIELSRADSLEYYRSIPSIDMQIGQ